MCLIAFSLDAHDAFALVVAANRDEYYARETAPAAWWNDAPGVFGGRDLRAGGSWLAIDRRGRLAAVTNVREPDPFSGPRSRGELVAGFVGGSMPAREYAESVLERAHEYAGFNLLLIDLAASQPGLFLSNRDPRRVVSVHEGVHALSNGELDSGWPKVRRLSDRLASALLGPPAQLGATLFEALADRSIPDDSDLPDTGVGIERERALAPVMLSMAELGYGTRASTLVVVRNDGRVAFAERTWRPDGDALRVAGERRVRFRLDRATRRYLEEARARVAS